jgi:hypothetical protein
VKKMDIKEKQQRLKRMLDIMTADQLKEISNEAFLKGLEQGMKIQCMTNNQPVERASA